MSMHPSGHVNIDGDVVLYSVGFAAQRTAYCVDGSRFLEKEAAEDYCDRYAIDDEEITKEFVPEPIEHALSSVKRLLNRIVESSMATTHNILLTGGGNFRDKVARYQPYKGNRQGAEKPVHYQAIKDYLINVKGAQVVEGEEADDQLSIRAVRDGATIATIDKDLNNTAGWHYNWQRDELYHVNPIDANRNFYKQLLTGDATDHIPGLFKFTGTKASKKFKDAVDECTTPEEMWEAVLRVYIDASLKDIEVNHEEPGITAPAVNLAREVSTSFLTEIGQLLWMRREEGEMWTPPESDA